MLLCLDVHYRDPSAVAAGVLFSRWADAVPARTLLAHVASVAPYVPGSFFARELPCLMAVITQAQAVAALTTVLVDAHVWLDASGRPGLGAHLYKALGEKTPVVGIAKTPFDPGGGGAVAIEVLRGASAVPLYVTAAGVGAAEAAANVKSMHGPYRLPTLVKLADTLCRNG